MSRELNCGEVLRVLSRYLDDEVSRELRTDMQAHFATCRHCTAVLDGTRNVLRLVADGRTFELPARFGQRLFKLVCGRTCD